MTPEHWSDVPVRELHILRNVALSMAVNYRAMAKSLPKYELSVSRGLKRPRQVPIHLAALNEKWAASYLHAIKVLEAKRNAGL